MEDMSYSYDNKEESEQKWNEFVENKAKQERNLARFKQKSDFYSLFACIFELRKVGTINHSYIVNIRDNITLMTENVGPQSEIEKYREYAMRCLSDANSVSSRKWRVQFLKEILEPAYTNEE